MKEIELRNHLKEHFPKENESCEWKEFRSLKHSFSARSGDDIISYISALSNMEGGHLVIGVHDETLEITGIEEFNNHTVQNIKLRIVDKCTNIDSDHLKIDEIITDDSHKTVWIIHVPKHLPRRPVYAHSKAWQRIEDSLIELRQERQDAILKEPIATNEDWSAQIIPSATLDDLDPVALKNARENYKEKFPRLALEVDEWDDCTFLNKAKVTIKGKITNTAIILLGKNESEHFIGPAQAKISWILKNDKNEEMDWEHFGPPLLVSVNHVFDKIRNLKYRYIVDNSSLFPKETETYDPFVIREALHNCIAHQDYTLAGKSTVVEFPKKLVFSNKGSFIPADVIAVLHRDSPDTYYRNKFLTDAMVNLNMIDTIGSGIKRMFRKQKERFFPLPEYSIHAATVSVDIIGEILKQEYTQYLALHPETTLDEAYILDKEQKENPLTPADIIYLNSINYNLLSPVKETEQVKIFALSAQEKKILKFCSTAKSRAEILAFLSLANQTKNFNKYIQPLFENHWIEYTIKENPKDRNQKYILSEQGKKLLSV